MQSLYDEAEIKNEKVWENSLSIKKGGISLSYTMLMHNRALEGSLSCCGLENNHHALDDKLPNVLPILYVMKF